MNTSIPLRSRLALESVPSTVLLLARMLLEPTDTQLSKDASETLGPLFGNLRSLDTIYEVGAALVRYIKTLPWKFRFEVLKQLPLDTETQENLVKAVIWHLIFKHEVRLS